MERGESKREQRSIVTNRRNCFASVFLVIEPQNIRAKGISDITAPNLEAGRRFSDMFKATLCVPNITSTGTTVF